MPTHQDQGTTEGIHFCTATCWDWLPLIERTALYDHIYQWMHLIAAKGCRTLGYVIMPNHLHLLVHVPEGLSINMLLANMKRFAAYEVIKRLQGTGRQRTLESPGVRSYPWRFGKGPEALRLADLIGYQTV
ncbi:MAG: transposase [Flavobacteriales bacterium]|nr:transposase [Flavobacteriales bacterium]